MADYLDNFTDTDGTLLGAHTADSGHKYQSTTLLEIESNRLWSNTAGTASGSDSILVLESDGVTPYVTGAQFDIEAGFYSKSSSGQITFSFCRDDTAGDAYSLAFVGNTDKTARLAEFVDGVFTIHGSFIAENGDVIKVEVRETTLEVFKNGTSQIGPITNTKLVRSGNLSFSEGRGTGTTIAGYRFDYVSVTEFANTQAIRKSSTFDIETTLSGTITTATLNGVNVFDHVSQTGTTVSFAGAATDEITTSGEYTLTLGDGTGIEDITVQVNVIGIPSFNINKAGINQGDLTDIEVILITGIVGSRVISEQITGITTTVNGDTGPIEVSTLDLTVDDMVTVVQQSPTVGGGAVSEAILEFI